jgi:hypothetical protein
LTTTSTGTSFTTSFPHDHRLLNLYDLDHLFLDYDLHRDFFHHLLLDLHNLLDDLLDRHLLHHHPLDRYLPDHFLLNDYLNRYLLHHLLLDHNLFFDRDHFRLRSARRREGQEHSPCQHHNPPWCKITHFATFLLAIH